jgi:uncharacterized protein (TIGR03083 family)
VDYRAALVDQNRAFGELVGDADPSTPVPTCPGWAITQLFRHVGRGDRWAAQIVADRSQEAIDPRTVQGGKPAEDADVADWLRGGAQDLIDAVARVGAETAVWTFLGPRPAAWWIRRRLHEATVHRADAALALGVDYQLAPDLAADGISEWLDRVAIQANPDAMPLEPGRMLHLHATDEGLGADGEWTIRADGRRAGAQRLGDVDTGIWWTHDHGKGDAAVRGPAQDLLLAIVRRRSPADAGIDVLGDSAVWDGWLERTPF